MLYSKDDHIFLYKNSNHAINVQYKPDESMSVYWIDFGNNLYTNSKNSAEYSWDMYVLLSENLIILE